jgi:hypothetical protein
MIERVQAVVDLIATERERFERFCRSLSEEELGRPVPASTWIVKDFISHLATIDPPVARWLASLADGRPTMPGEGGRRWDVDRYNDDAVAERRQRPVEEILAEAARERAALLQVLDGLTEAQIDQSIHFGGDSKRPPSELVLERYLQGWARHDLIHVADMLRALPERAADPEVLAWLREPGAAAVVGAYQDAMALKRTVTGGRD